MANFSIRTTMHRMKVKARIESAFGPDVYRAVRAKGLGAEKSLDRFRSQILQRVANHGISNDSPHSVKNGGVSWSIVTGMTLSQAIEANFHMVTGALNNANVLWWLVDVDADAVGPTVIGIDKRQRKLALSALSALGLSSPAYATRLDDTLLLRHVSRLASNKDFDETEVISVFEPRVIDGSPLKYGPDSACQVEFWEHGEDGYVLAPRENKASRIISSGDFSLESTVAMGITAKIPAVLTRTMLDDVNFPVDAVYTWVDGEDSSWLESKRRTEAEIAGVPYHEEANHAARFRSRDELKFSLRSLEMYAPWFRKIYIVTAGQVPEWLNIDHPQIQLVDHKEIYPDSSYLPTFNSNSIISRLHHIEGLSEHYVYINDDVFFGRPLAKGRFFTPSGIAKVSPSNNRRPFGDPTADEEPHLNLTRNMRHLIQEEFGITISRAIKHTPHPQLRSVHFAMESKFGTAYEKTWASRFRHHDDIVADQLHHYYAQIVGRAIPTNLKYNYINILDDKYKNTLDATLRLRHRDTFCINDAPVDGATPIPDHEVNTFLESYFPVKSAFEK